MNIRQGEESSLERITRAESLRKSMLRFNGEAHEAQRGIEERADREARKAKIRADREEARATMAEQHAQAVAARVQLTE